MELSKNERYTLIVLFSNLLLQFILWTFSGFNVSRFTEYLFPFRSSYANESTYDVSEFLIWGIIPLAIFAIYYYLVRNK